MLLAVLVSASLPVEAQSATSSEAQSTTQPAAASEAQPEGQPEEQHAEASPEDPASATEAPAAPSFAPGSSAAAFTARLDPRPQHSGAEADLRSSLSEDHSGSLLNGALFDSHRVRLSPGRRVVAKASTEAFDPVLVVIDPDGVIQEINDDWDPKIGTDSAVEFFPDQHGVYEVWVTATNQASGDYSLSLDTTFVQSSTGELVVGDLVEGWLVPGDGKNRRGLYRDRWDFVMPSWPVAFWASSDSLDVYVAVRSAEGENLFWANDLDPVGGNRNALLSLDPDRVGEGSRLEIEVGSLGPTAAGAYQLRVGRLPLDVTPVGAMTVRLLRVRGSEGEGGSRASIENILTAFEAARQAWSQCGIELQLDDEFLHEPIEIPGAEGTLAVDGQEWSPVEREILAHPLRLGPESYGTTVFFVAGLNTGEKQGLAYPTTRYSPRRTGVLISDGAVEERDSPLTLAHELGHMLGLLHSSPSDGDTANDVDENLMTIIGEDQLSPVGQLTPFQCAVARRSPRLVKYPSGEKPSGLFVVQDRMLALGGQSRGTLSDGDNALPTGHILDLHYFEAKAQGEVKISLSSDSFDPFLLLETAEGVRLGEDDDSGSGNGASLELTLPASGDYVIGVTSTRPGAQGSYRLELSSVERDPQSANEVEQGR